MKLFPFLIVVGSAVVFGAQAPVVSSSNVGSSSSTTSAATNATNDTTFGDVLYAADILQDELVIAALKQLGQAQSSSTDGGSDEAEVKKDALLLLELLSNTTGDTERVTLSLMGYKGGALKDQINQDQGFVWNDNNSNSCAMVGVLDGHGDTGHFVSQHVREQLIQRLGGILTEPGEDTNDSIKKRIIQTFLSVNEAIPKPFANGGGATVSIVLKRNDTIYVANAGDSQSLIAAAVTVPKTTGTTASHSQEEKQQTRIILLYASRLDKPDNDDERARILKAGGMVSEASEDDDARVSYMQDGREWGLAMSRSLGDFHATGVTAEPRVDVLFQSELEALARKQVRDSCAAAAAATAAVDDTEEQADGICAALDNTAADSQQLDVQLFCVSATDGMIDYFEPAELAKVMGSAFFDQSNNVHPLKAAEALIQASSKYWWDDFDGQYRDDITISAAKIQ